MNTLKAARLRLVVAAACLVSSGLHAGTVHYYYYTDQNGNVLAKADAQGNIVARYDYKPYGASVLGMGDPPNGPLFWPRQRSGDRAHLYTGPLP